MVRGHGHGHDIERIGLAVGLSAFNPRSGTAIAHGVSAAVMVWMILTWRSALWIGAMFASWFDGRNDTEMGVVRGLTVWGMSMAVTALLVATGLAHSSVSMSDRARRRLLQRKSRITRRK